MKNEKKFQGAKHKYYKRGTILLKLYDMLSKYDIYDDDDYSWSVKHPMRDLMKSVFVIFILFSLFVSSLRKAHHIGLSFTCPFPILVDYYSIPTFSTIIAF